MPLKPVINEPFDMIILDMEKEVLEKYEHEVILEYEMTRDLNVFEDNFARCSEPPTIFTIIPTLPENEYLLPLIATGNMASLREFVRRHIIDAKGCDFLKFEQKNNKQILTEKSCSEIALPYISEIAKVIQDGCVRGHGIPFSSTDGWKQKKRNLVIRNVMQSK